MVLKTTYILIVISCFLIAIPSYSNETAFQYERVESGKCLFEVLPGLDLNTDSFTKGIINTGFSDLDEYLTGIGASELSRKSAKYQPRWYSLKFSPEHSVEDVVFHLQSIDIVDNAWPCPLVKTFEMKYHPDDFLYPAQWHPETIQAPQAWSVYRGSSDVEVGIIDSGVNYEHEDLAPAVWINPGEDLNGNGVIDVSDWNNTDDDSNGYIDDFWGWDWVNVGSSAVWPGEDPGPPDNDPMDFGGHGTHCAGDACAATDNFAGVTSPGFNSKIMCLRAGYTEAGTGMGLVSLEAAIDAVYYAIDMGAEVISMSFGGSTMYPPFMQALQTAANAGLVLAASAGNDDNNEIQYPAGYTFVNAIAATAKGDIKADFSSYGTWVTVSAPGNQIYSTIPDGYGNMDGTSMSCPIAAGLCALIKGLKPEWSSNEVGDWLAETADDIDYLNPLYAGQLGGGRINAYKAVDLFVSIDSLWIDLPVDGERLPHNTEGALFVQFHKRYDYAIDVSLQLSSENPRVSFSQDYYYIGDLYEGESGINEIPFLITVAAGEDEYEMIELDATFSGYDFEFTQIIEIPAGYPDVVIIDADRDNTENTAFYYGQTLEAMGYSSEIRKLSDMEGIEFSMFTPSAVIAFSGTAEDSIFSAEDWQALENYFYTGGRLIISGQNIAQDCAVNHPDILQTFLWSSFVEEHSNDLTVAGNPNYTPAQDYYLVMAGSGGAWNQNSLDVIEPLPIAQTVFVYNENNLDRAAGIYWQSTYGKMFFCSFGIEGINDDASTGNSKQEVLQMMFEEFGLSYAGDAQTTSLPISIELKPVSPNPFNNAALIRYTLNQSQLVKLTVYDILGRETSVLINTFQPAGVYELIWNTDETTSSGIYFLRLEAGEETRIRKAVLLK